MYKSIFWGNSRSFWDLPVLAVLCLSFFLKLINLDHSSLTHWDEVFHANVAKNVYKHPFYPTFIDKPYLAYDYKDWTANHVWLHKPIVPFWEAALSFAVFGVNAFALRLPSVILSTGAVWLTYLIGKQLWDPATACLAAVLQAMSSSLLRIIHGHQFVDIVDISLLFWVELGIFFLLQFLEDGKLTNIALAGIALGMAFHSKTYPALIILLIYLCVILVHRIGLMDLKIAPATLRSRFPFYVFLISSAAIILPWNLYLMYSFPREFWHEHQGVLNHLYIDVEHWAAPWDRLIFDYSVFIYDILYFPLLAAMIVFVPRLRGKSEAGPWITYIWALGVILPYLFAVTKTPSATILALPACLFLVARFLLLSLRSGDHFLVLAAIILGTGIATPWGPRNPGHGFPPPNGWFGGVFLESPWIAHQLVAITCALAVYLGLLFLTRFLSDELRSVLQLSLRSTARSAVVIGLLFVAFHLALNDYLVLNMRFEDHNTMAVKDAVNINCPDNAAILLDRSARISRESLMFYSDRTVYYLDDKNFQGLAREIKQRGGIPYFITKERHPYKVIDIVNSSGLKLYQLETVEAE